MLLAHRPKFCMCFEDSPLNQHLAQLPHKAPQLVKTAHQKSTDGDIVTLSPACASFDAFPNFAVRGNYFKELVNKL